MITTPLFYFICCLLLLLSCGWAASKQTQLQNNDTLSGKEIKIDTITYDTINFKTMKSQEKYSVIKRFDIQLFETEQEYWRYEFTDNNGMIVVQSKSYEDMVAKTVVHYTDDRHYPNSAYKYCCEYDEFGFIAKSLTIFYSLTISIIYYDQANGEIIKTENTELFYKFSIDYLILKMLKEYGVDIENSENMWDIRRYIYNNKGYYEVSVKFEGDLCIDVYLIDGDSGETLFNTKRETQWHPDQVFETIMNEYLRVKKIK